MACGNSQAGGPFVNLKHLAARVQKIEAKQPADPHCITLEELGRFIWRNGRQEYFELAKECSFLRILAPRYEAEDRLKGAAR